MTQGNSQHGWPGQHPGEGQQGYPAPQQPGYPAPQQPDYPAAPPPQYGAPAPPYGQQGHSYPAPGYGQQGYAPPQQPGEPQQGYGYPAPRPQQPLYGAPAPTYGQQGYGNPAPQYQQGNQYQQPTGYAASPDAPPPPSRQGKTPAIVTAAVVVAALVVAAVVFVTARGSQTAGGAETPQQAVANLLGAVSNADIPGALDQLAPGEARLFADVQRDWFTELQRLTIVDPSATSGQLIGVDISLTNVTYAGIPVAINDHIKIVQITGGALTTTPQSGPSALSDKVQTELPELAAALQQPTQPTTVNIAQKLASEGMSAVRIATVKRGGEWYPSLMYTIADNAAFAELGPGYGARLTPIPNRGGNSPAAAMNSLLTNFFSGNLRGIIGQLDPASMGVMHDYASLVLRDAREGFDEIAEAGIFVTDAQWTVTDVSGGKKVSLGTLKLMTPDGQITVTRDVAAGSLTVTTPGQPTILLDANSVISMLQGNRGPLTDRDLGIIDPAGPAGGLFGAEQGFGSGSAAIPPQVRDLITREFQQLLGLGIVMVQAGDGQWYVDPLRTSADIVTSLLQGIEPADIDYLIRTSQGS